MFGSRSQETKQRCAAGQKTIFVLSLLVADLGLGQRNKICLAIWVMDLWY